MFDATEREADAAALSVRFLHVEVMETCRREADDSVEQLKAARLRRDTVRDLEAISGARTRPMVVDDDPA